VELGVIPEGAGITKEQIEELIVKYAKQGMSPAGIGEKLKREHNVPYVRQYTGKRLTQILKEKKLAGEIPSDLMDLMRSAVTMRGHLEKNKQDKYNSLRLKRVESKIWRLTRYYVREGTLPQGWKYDPKQAELLIKGKG
jgi:small subunit ribosomal protein S15